MNSNTQDTSVTVQDDRDLGAFIPSFFDDFGLDPYEFRIYCRLARRAGNSGECWESVDNIAKGCLMSRRKATYCLRVLELMNIIQPRKQDYRTTVYKLLPQRVWHPQYKLPFVRESVSIGNPENKPKHKKTAPHAEGVAYNAEGAAPHADKGQSIKVLPLREDNIKESVNHDSLSGSVAGCIAEPEGSTGKAASLPQPATTQEEYENRLSDNDKLGHSSTLVLNDTPDGLIEQLKEIQPPNKHKKKIINTKLQGLIHRHFLAAQIVFHNLVESGKFKTVKNPAGYFYACLCEYLGLDGSGDNKDVSHVESELSQPQEPANPETFCKVPEPSEDIKKRIEPNVWNQVFTPFQKDGINLVEVPSDFLDELSSSDCEKSPCVLFHKSGIRLGYKGGMGTGYLSALTEDHEDWSVCLPDFVVERLRSVE